MTILILAAGYATRLYPLTLDKPKPLLKVGARTIIEHIIEKISQINGPERCFIVTNQKFFKHFQKWASNFSALPAFGGRGGKFSVPIEVINDETTSNETRLGAIRDIEFVIKKKAIKDNLLVIGGDNLFEFSLKEFVEFAEAHRPDVSLAVFDIKAKEKAKQYGVVKIDSSNRVINFQEKPPKPESTLISTCVYYFPKDKLNLMSHFLSSGNKADAPGNYIKWLSENDKVYAFVFEEDWYDIGDIASYEAANKVYSRDRFRGGQRNLSP